MKSFRIIAVIAGVVLLGVVGYYLYDRLRPLNTTEKLARIIHTEDERLLSDDLIRYLRDDTTRVRARACLAVGRVAAKKSGDLLIEMVKDPAQDVSRTAAFALGIAGDKTKAQPLLDVAADLTATSTAAALVAVGRLADTARPELAAELAGYLSHPAPEVREAACYGLFYAGAKNEADAVVAQLAVEQDRAVQYAALYMLSRLGIGAGAEAYDRFQADADPQFRMLAVRGLQSATIKDALRSVALSLNDKDNRVVAQAVTSLRDRREPKAADYIANKLGDEDDENLIILMLGALRSLHSPLGEATARMHLSSALSDNLVIASLGYLAEIHGDQMVATVDSLRNAGMPPRVRAACADAYGEMNTSTVVSRLAMLFKDEDPLVRATALPYLLELDSVNTDLYLKEALGDRDIMPQILALDQIGSKHLMQYLPQVQQLFARGGAVDVDVRRTLIDVVNSFIEERGADSLMAELLVKGILDKEYVVRKAAAEAYEKWYQRDRFNKVTPAATRISESRLRQALAKAGPAPTALILTEKGEIEIELNMTAAPLTVLTFMELARDGFYDGLIFHRVVPNFVVQGGDPRGDGWGGPDFFIRDEYSDVPFRRGTVGIATSGHDTGGSQFFITHSPQPHLNARYTVFGQVTHGMDVVDRLTVGDVIQKIIVKD